MVAVLRIVAIPILASLYLLLTPFVLLVIMFRREDTPCGRVKDEEKYHAKEASEESPKPLESSDRVELHGRPTDKPMATVSVHRSAEAKRRRELVSPSSEEEDSLLPRKLRENGHGRQQQRPEASLRRIRTKSVRHW